MYDPQRHILHDLSLTYGSDTAGYAWETARTRAEHGWNARWLRLYSHAGTHMDAPPHFGVNGRGIDRYPPSRFVTVAHLVRIEVTGPRQLLTVADLGEVADRFRAGESLLLRTDWSARRGTTDYRDALPRISPDLALWCVARGVNVLGVEPPSVADVNDLPEVTLVHRILLEGDVIIVEGLTGLDRIAADQVTLIALPLKIADGDGAPARVIALEDRLPSPADDMGAGIRRLWSDRYDVVIVLDDDPTGTQTVYDVPVITQWSEAAIGRELAAGTPLFFLLTNSRALTPLVARDLAREIGTNIRAACAAAGRRFLLVSRGDSTLRGHYPVETDALKAAAGIEDAVDVLIPAFFEGGRFTIEDVHYVREGERMLPAATTPFAADPSFGYRHSNLRRWVEEKTEGRVRAGQVGSLRDATLPGGEVIVVNAVSYADLRRAARTVLSSGIEPLFRTAASFVAVLLDQPARDLLTARELGIDAGGGLIVVGSYVPKTTAQLQHLRAQTALTPVEIEVDVQRLLTGAEAVLQEVAAAINVALAAGQTALVYTSRELVVTEDVAGNLDIGARISAVLHRAVAALTVRPAWILTKGGITSSEVATEGLGVARARVRGQLLPGVPVWELGEESKFPGLPYVIFPGNVGDDRSLTAAVQTLNARS